MAHPRDENASLKFPDEYWVNLEGTDLAREAWNRWVEYHEWLTGSSRLHLLRTSADAYYGREAGFNNFANRGVQRHKQNPGVLKVKSNHYGATARQKVTLVTSKPLTFQVFTTNTDTSSQSAASSGRSLLEYLKRTKDLERLRATLAKHAVVYLSGFLSWEWDSDSGDDIPPEAVPEGDLEYLLDPDGNPVVDESTGSAVLAKMPKYGDVVLRNHTPVDVAYDFCASNADMPWIILRHFESRYDLAAKYPQLKAEILALSGEKRDEWRIAAFNEGLRPSSSSDLIPVYRLVHRRTPACPDGREALFLSRDILLRSGPLEYGVDPFVRCAEEDADDSAEGHSSQIDHLGLQEAHDATLSTALSKQQASLPKPFVALQANIAKKDLGGGFQVFTVNGAPKDMVQFIEYQSSAEKDIQLAGYFQQQIETGTGINPILRGNTEAVVSGASGRAVAFMQAQAAIANWPLERQLREAMAKMAMGLVDTYRRHHRAKQQLIIISGKAQESQTVEFTGSKDLEGVRAVTVEQGDPITGTPAGRLELLGLLKEELAVQGIDFNKAYQIITEGRWEPAIEDISNMDQQIRSENEQLAKGVQIQPLETEHHLKHILGHLAFANRSSLPIEVNANALMHIRLHIYQWRIADPALLAVLGIPPAPPDPLMMPQQYAAQMAQAQGEQIGAATPMPQSGQPGGAMGGDNGVPAGAVPPDGQPTAEDQNPGMPTLPNGNVADPANQGAPPFPTT